MNIVVPQHRAPKHLTITQGMLEDLLYRPDMAAWVFFKVKLDIFQQVRLKEYWFSSDVEDSSGFSSAKTIVDWIFINLSAVLIWDCHCLVIYQTFQSGVRNFWKYYNEFSTPLFRAQLGRMDLQGDESGKSDSKMVGCYTQHFKNRSHVMLPAPGFASDGRNMAGLRCNRLLVEEWPKIVESESGMSGVTKQLLGRVTRNVYNETHPVFCNKVLRTATAEQGSHPAYPWHLRTVKKVKDGDPSTAVVNFSFKDYSHLDCGKGKSFRQAYRQDKIIKGLRENNSEEGYRAEALGIWSKSSKGWYSEQMIEAAQEMGRSMKLTPLISRQRDPNGAKAHYFLGLDPAPAQGQRSDDGGIAVLRALESRPNPEQESDYDLDYVYARRVTRNDRADVERWSGIIHEKEIDFGFSMIGMDLGGGGQWVAPHLRKGRQIIHGIETQCRPIVERTAADIEGSPTLVLFKRGDDYKELFPELKNARGDDVLTDFAHTIFQTAIGKGSIRWPKPAHEWTKAEIDEALPSQEEQWALKNLTAMCHQLVKIRVRMRADGSWEMTRNGARQFFSDEKKDLAYAGLQAYLAFRIWLGGNDFGFRVKEEDAAGFC